MVQSVRTEDSCLGSGHNLECAPSRAVEHLVNETEVVIERNTNHEFVGVPWKPESSPHILKVSVKIRNEVATHFVPERSQPILERNRLPIPFSQLLAQCSAPPVLHLELSPRRPTYIIGRREPLRVEIRGETHNVRKHISYRPRRRRRNRKRQLIVRQCAHGRDEVLSNTFVDVPRINACHTRGSRVLHDCGLPAKPSDGPRHAAEPRALTMTISDRQINKAASNRPKNAGCRRARRVPQYAGTGAFAIAIDCSKVGSTTVRNNSANPQVSRITT